MLLSLVAVCTIASPVQLDTAVVRQGKENQVATDTTPNHNGGDDLGDDGPGDDGPAGSKKKTKKLSNEEKARLSGDIHSFGNGNSDDVGEDKGEKNGADSGEDKYGNDIGEDQSDNTGGHGVKHGADDKGEDGKDDGDDGKGGDDGKENGEDGSKSGSSNGRGKDGSGNADNEAGVGAGSFDGAKAGKAENHTGHNHSEKAVCFPGAALVELKNGEFVEMATLKIGDEVSTGNGQFSKVFMFTHRLPTVHASFVQVTAASGARLRLTAGHYLPVNGEYSPASSVQVGDEVVLSSGMNSCVVRVETVSDVGLFNPQTRHGDIVVDGVRASTYTTAVKPIAAHALLAPVRAAFARLGLAMTVLESGSQTLANAAQCLFA